MANESLTLEDREQLLRIAREALMLGVYGKPVGPIEHRSFSEKLRENGASFVTLTKGGRLRGCIGTLEPYQPLINDVREHAVAAATQDYRFPPVKPDELKDIKIEISRLTKPKPLAYSNYADLLSKLRPGIDGVVLLDGFRKATFLPQVWDKIPDPGEFLSHLSTKMGLPSNAWQVQNLDVLIYQVEEFHEK